MSSRVWRSFVHHRKYVNSHYRGYDKLSISSQFATSVTAMNHSEQSLKKPYTVQLAMKKRIVLLGTGWGCYSVLQSIDKKKYDVTVISPRNHFLFTPLLASTAVGTLEFRSIIEPLRDSRGFNPDTCEFQLSRAEHIDFDEQLVTFRSTVDHTVVSEIKYDTLVIGVGAISNTFGVPGVSQYAYFLKEIAHAQKIRQIVLSNFDLATMAMREEEKKRLLHFVIVGGGPTGVEFSAELSDFLTQDLSKKFPKLCKETRITLLEPGKILGSFSEKLQKYAEKTISTNPHVELVKKGVIEVTKDGVRLSDDTFLPCGLVVWSTGITARPFVKHLGLELEKGFISTDPWLRAKHKKNVYAIGDCARIEGIPLPATAQVAERQGRYLAKTLSGPMNAHGELIDPPPFKFQSMGMLAYVGRYKAVADTPAAKGKGNIAWVFWRSAYLTRLGSWRLRMQVPIDWFKTFFFGRDVNLF